ncbi:13257_t:CDS:2 [Entrophospora sp. SA101]|nr:13257_t:CDS:2 [Entrophospora sp. SA101]
MTLPKSTQKITDKLNQKMNISNTSELWLGKRKLHASSFEFTENSDSNPTSIISKHASSHGLVSAIIHSYTLHQHLRLSPDDVWLTIAQCISRHIWNNAERFRYLFVSHEGHEDVFVDARDIIGYVNQNFIGDWSQAISRLSKTIDKRVKKVGLKQHLECDFSISTISWYELFSSIFDGVKDNLIQLGSDIEISFMELVKGAKQTTAIETIAFCKACNGLGTKGTKISPGNRCPTCSGIGQ